MNLTIESFFNNYKGGHKDHTKPKLTARQRMASETFNRYDSEEIGDQPEFIRELYSEGQIISNSICEPD